MRKQSLLVLLLCIAASFDSIHAAAVSMTTAQTAAINFFRFRYPTAGAVTAATLVYTQTETDGIVDYYVFNVSPAKGFVIVSADNNIAPVIAHSNESYFRYSANVGIADWMKHAALFIHSAILRGDQADAGITASWAQCLTTPNRRAGNTTVITTVGPLVQTRYDQETDTTRNPPPYLYNLFCPENTTQNERCVTGCVATTMAQIMRFWNYPATGTGSYSYNDATSAGYTNTYGTQSANFGTTTYNWALMPTQLLLNTPAVQDTAVSLLMYHAGVSVAMDYGDDTQDGSGAIVLQSDAGTNRPCAQQAYSKYFRYDPKTLFGMKQTNYTGIQWQDSIIQEIKAGRPVQYAGQGSGGGHTWVCDGYELLDSAVVDTLFRVHMNWGWGGYANGYFAVYHLNAGGYTFNSDEEILIGIKPIDTIHVTASVATSPLCAGGSTQLTATGAPSVATYTWTPTTGLSCATCAVTNVTPTATTTYTVTADSAGFLKATSSVLVTVSPVPVAPASVTLPTAPCTGATATYTVPAVSGATSYTWAVSNSDWVGSSATNSITYTAGASATTVSVTAHNSCGTGPAYVFTAPHSAGPTAPLSVTLPTAPCTGATAVYTVPVVVGATSYTWTESTGWSGTSASNTITLTAGSSAGTVSVTANNACGSSAPYVFTAPHGSGPSAPASVTLPTAPCTGAAAVYTVPAVSGATSYTWTESAGWSGSSTSNTITLTAGSSAGSVSVTANNACGSSAAYVFNAPHGAGPSAPASVTLPTTPCAGSTAIYTIPAVSGATTYTWAESTGWSGTSTTNSITLTAGTSAGTVSVTANNACGSSTAYTFATPVSAKPAAPASATLPAAPCTGATAIYTIPTVSGATSYTWSVTGTGWNGTSASNSITYTAGTDSALISVKANNTCGSSAAYVFTAPHGVGPAAPASVTLPTAPCTNGTAIYTIPAVSGATSYTWAVSGTSWSGSSTNTSITLTAGTGDATVSVTANSSCGSSAAYTFTAPHGAGPAAPASVTLPVTPCEGATAIYTVPAVSGATSYTWTYSGTGWSGSSISNAITLTAGASLTTIAVTANNACGASSAYTFIAHVNTPPVAPASVTMPVAPCPGVVAAYSVQAISGASSYTWTVGGTGWSGTSTSNSINLTAGTVAGSISVVANNICGSSTPLAFSAPLGAAPSAPASVTLPSAPCANATAAYTIPAVSGATSYTWTVSGAGWSGTSTTNSITLTAGTVAGSVSVTANSACGSSSAYTFTAPIGSSAPAAPASVTLPVAPCAGTTAVYTVPAVAGATSYTWTVGTGWSGSSTINSITLTAGSSAGSVSVTANNACGSSAAYVFTPASAPYPSAATTIAVPAVCAGQATTLSTPAIANATSYNWIYTTAGWSGTSTTNTITLSPGSTPLTISVNGVNACGSGLAYSISNISVLAIPVASYTLSSPSIAVAASESVVFTGTAPGGSTYTWDFDGGSANPGTGAGPQTVYWSTAGTKIITLVVNNGGCNSSTFADTVHVGESSTGINNVAIAAIDAINIIPNPASGQANIFLSATEETTVNVEAYDMAGRLVGNIYSGTLAVGEKSISFNTDNIAAGIYVVKVTDGKSMLQKRFVKL